MAMRRRRHKNNSGSETCICDLPNPITSDILSRLPINTIAHSMCVCKTWRNLVSDPDFVKLHFARSSKSVSLLCPYPSSFLSGIKPMYVVDEHMKGGRLYYQKSILGRFNVHNFPLLILDIVCSCDGMLLCVCCMQGTVYICNPIKSLGWVELPRPKVEPSPDRSKLINYGFGFCNQSNQYKVVRFVTTGTANPLDDSRVARCEMLALGSDEWRCLGDFPFEQHCPGLSFSQTASPWIPLNGSLHLLVKAKEGEYRGLLFISCFKLYEEELMILAPVPLAYNTFSTLTLGVLKNCLVLFIASDHQSQVDIWVMNEYGVNKSWTKSCVIKRDMLKGVRYASWLKPIKFTEDGELLMSYSCQNSANDSALVSYDPVSKRIRKHKFNNIQYRQQIDYVPSLLSPTDFAMKRNNTREDGYEPSEEVVELN